MPRAISLYLRCFGLFLALLSLLSPVVPVSGGETQESTTRSLVTGAPPYEVRAYEVRGATRRQLSRFEQAIRRAQWEDALEIADQLLISDSREVVSIGESHYVGLREYCHRQLSQLPPEVLAEYRALVDAPAEAWYRKGVAERNTLLLQRVVEEAFCSSWGDDALDALGELALERGEYLAARMHWEKIGANQQDASKTADLTYPDTNLNLAAVQARLILVSLREGNFERAKEELEKFSEEHGEARGKLGGEEVVFAEALDELLEQAKSSPTGKVQNDWPTYAGAPNRTNFNRVHRPKSIQQVWSSRLSRSAVENLSEYKHDAQAGVQEAHLPALRASKFLSAARLSERNSEKPSTFPVVSDNLVLWHDTSQVHALSLNSGQEVFSSRGEVFESLNEQENAANLPVQTLMASGHHVYGTTSKFLKRRRAHGTQNDSQLWGIDLNRDGALNFRVALEESGVEYAGPPLVVGSQLFVAIHSQDHAARLGIACYDLGMNELRWQQWICQTVDAATNGAEHRSSNLLTYDSGMIFCGTNIGAIASVRARDGQVQWIRTYDRGNFLPGVDDKLAGFRLQNPCIYNQGVLFIAPLDSDKLFALEADSGKTLWEQERASLTGEIIGAVDGWLFVSDRGLKAVEGCSGRVVTLNADLRLFGQPAITENLIFWPSYQKIEIIDLTTGKAVGEAIPLAEQDGANIVVVGDTLVAAGRTRITVFRFATQ